MGREVVLIVALLCLLQCVQFICTQNSSTKTVKTKDLFRVRIPTRPVSPLPSQSNNVPYPYFTRFSNNPCSSCQPSSGVCQSSCINTNNQLNLQFNSNQNPIGISFPSGNGNAVDMVLNYLPTCQQSVDVVVTVKASNETKNGTVTTTANSTATQNVNGTQLEADSTASDGDDDIDVSVIVNDVTPGSKPKDTKVNSVIVEDDGNGNQATAQTQAELAETPKGNQNGAPVPPGNPPANTTKPTNPAPDGSAPANPPADSTPAANPPANNPPAANPPDTTQPAPGDSAPASPDSTPGAASAGPTPTEPASEPTDDSSAAAAAAAAAAGGDGPAAAGASGAAAAGSK